MARLMLVTHYAGTKMVRVYNEGTETENPARKRVASASTIRRLATKLKSTKSNNVVLTSAGNYYPAGDSRSGVEGELGFERRSH